ncbi:cobalamin biosynthesis protein [Citrobacter freundii]|nr:cobalamin biosynthesis protein [Citrobacter freundii]
MVEGLDDLLPCWPGAAWQTPRRMSSVRYVPVTLQQVGEKLSWIVGRDTSQLQPQQINRGVVETVAENTVDGIIARCSSCSSAVRLWRWPTKR